MPILEDKVHITSMDYSPLVGGFAITLNDGRAAFLTANNLKFDPNVRKTHCSFFIIYFFFFPNVIVVVCCFSCSKFKEYGLKILMMLVVPQ